MFQIICIVYEVLLNAVPCGVTLSTLPLLLFFLAGSVVRSVVTFGNTLNYIKPHYTLTK